MAQKMETIEFTHSTPTEAGGMTRGIICHQFDRLPTYDGAQEDMRAIDRAIGSAFSHHFVGAEDGAEAYNHYRNAAKAAGDDSDLFSPEEHIKGAAGDYPRALEWMEFLETAEDAAQGVFENSALAGVAQKYSVSIKMISDGGNVDLKPAREGSSPSLPAP